MDLTIFIGGQIAWLNAMRILEINSNQVKIQFYDDYINSAIWFRFFLHFKIFDSINLLSSAFKQRREFTHTHTFQSGIPANPLRSLFKTIEAAATIWFINLLSISWCDFFRRRKNE